MFNEMVEITNISYDALRKYFNFLSFFGYRNYEDVHRLLILLFINSIFTGECSEYVTEEDYRVIMNMVYLLTGKTCLISYMEFKSTATMLNSTSGTFVSIPPSPTLS